MHSPHPDDQTLKAYGLGKLDDGPASTVNDHLEDCAECRDKLSGLTSDSFLGRFRAAQPTASQSVLGASLGDGTVSFLQPRMSTPPPATDTLPPGLANHPDYEIKRELGRGGMGVVYLAHNTMMGRDEVLKVMGRHIMERPGVLERFQREIRAVAKLRHPNIVAAYHAFRIEGGLVFAMEYVEGLDLARLVKAKGPLSVSHAAYFVHQAALGLQHAHEKGLIHRDIKPHNLMLTHDGKARLVKVLDFGLAKATREEKIDGGLTSEGQALGTPDYIAPEQITNAIDVDVRADIYSLGGTLFYLLTGRPPFQATSFYEIYQAHMSRDVDSINLIRPEVPAELAALVGKMMAKEPRRRFETPAEICQALIPYFKKGSIAHTSPRADASPSAPTSPVRTDSGSPSILDRLGMEPGRSVLEPRKTAQPNSPGSAVGTGLPLADRSARANRPIWLVRSLVGLASLFFLFTLGIVIYVKTDKGRVRIVLDGPQPKAVVVDGETIRFEGRDETISLRSGSHEVKVTWRDGQEDFRAVKIGRGAVNEERFVRLLKPAPEKPLALEKPAASAGEGWVSLFNGKDLTGWKVDSGDESSWQVRDGELVARGLDRTDHWLYQGYLLSDREYSDFRLRFQYQRRTEDAESGVALRSLFHEMVRDSYPECWYNHPFHLTEIITNFGSKYPAGTLWWSPTVTIQEPLPPDNQAQLKPVGEWNDMVVEMRGQSLSIVINGREVLNAPLNKYRPAKFPAVGLSRYSGRIGFLIRKSEVRFRKIDILELGPSPASRYVKDNPVSPKKASETNPWPRAVTLAGEKFPQGTRFLAMSRDCRRVAVTDSTGQVAVIEASDVQRRVEVKGQQRVGNNKNPVYVNDADFSPDGKHLAVACNVPPDWIWDTTTGDGVRAFAEANYNSYGCAYSFDGRRVAFAGRNFKRVHVWDAVTGNKFVTLGPLALLSKCIAFSPDGRRLASGGGSNPGNKWEVEVDNGLGGELRIWDLEKSAVSALGGHPVSINGVAFSPEGQWLASASSDKKAKVWDVATGRCLVTFNRHDVPVRSVQFSPDGRFVASVGDENIVRVWDSTSGLELMSFSNLTGHPGFVQFSPEGRWIYSGGGETLRAWDLLDSKMGASVSQGTHPLASKGGSAVEPKAPEPATPAQLTPVPPPAPPKVADVKIDLLRVQGDEFLMGSRDDDFEVPDNEKPQHKVWLSPYFLGKTEVTQQQYMAVMGSNPSEFSSTGRFAYRFNGMATDAYPVENVSFYDAIKFCNALSRMKGREPYYQIENENDPQPEIKIPNPKGPGYRLPTEAEWECACRAGSSAKYAFGDDPTQAGHYAWIDENSSYTSHPVAEKRHNRSGFYDMHGNVMEWCWDHYATYTRDVVDNPQGPNEKTTTRVVRGGSFQITANACRPAIRDYREAGSKDERRGFRVASNQAGN